MKYKSLTSELGAFAGIILKIITLIYIGVLIYSIIVEKFGLSTFLIVALLLTFLKFSKKIFLSSKIEYSSNSIKVNGKTKNFSDIYLFEKGVIILIENISKKIYYNDLFSRNRFNELEDFLNENKLNK